MLSPYDWSLARRAAAIASLATLLALVVIATTDEGAPWTTRAGVLAALAPVAGAIGALSALRLASARGEIRALAALGVAPTRAASGAVLGGVVLGGLGPLLVWSGLVNIEGLFPRPLRPSAWIAEGASMRELAAGIVLRPGGLLEHAPPALPLHPEAPLPITFTAVALALAALGGPLWATAPRGLTGRVLIGVAALLATIAAFQGVAAGRFPPVTLVIGPALLLLDALVAHRRAGAT
jgi:hypothetical protein